MAEPRDANEVYAEQVSQCAAAVAKAMPTADAQQAQAGAWMDAGMSAEGYIVTPGPADAPSQ